MGNPHPLPFICSSAPRCYLCPKDSKRTTFCVSCARWRSFARRLSLCKCRSLSTMRSLWKSVSSGHYSCVHSTSTSDLINSILIQELDKLISFSGTPTVVWRRTGEICLVAPEFCMLTEWSLDELVGRKKYIYEVRLLVPLCRRLLLTRPRPKTAV